MANYSLSELIEGMKSEYADIDAFPQHMDAVKTDIMENLQAFLTGGQPQQQQNQMGQMPQLMQQQQQQIPTGEQTDMESPAMRRYKANLLVDNSELKGAPIIFEDNPTYANLVGKVEHMLRKDGVDAVDSRQFHIYPIENIDQGVECLTDMSAGEADENNQYPEESFNGRVQKRLLIFAENMQKFGREPERSEKGEERES